MEDKEEIFIDDTEDEYEGFEKLEPIGIFF